MSPGGYHGNDWDAAHAAWTKASGLGCGTGGQDPCWRAPEPSKSGHQPEGPLSRRLRLLISAVGFIVGARHPCGAVVVEWRPLRVSVLLLRLKLLH